MEIKTIFDASTKALDWQPITLSAVLFLGGCLSILFERLNWSKPVIKHVGYVVAGASLLVGLYLLTIQYIQSRDNVVALAAGAYQVVQGSVDNFQPSYHEGRKEESFMVSGQVFRYSDNALTMCFNQTEAHGGPIHAGISVRITYSDDCILRIEEVQHR